MNAHRKKRIHIIAIILAVVFLYFGYVEFRVWIADGFKDRIPIELKIDETVLVDGDMGGLGWCGVAIFKLQSDTLNNVRNIGLPAFSEASRSRNKNRISGDYQQYSLWRETPYIETGDGLTLQDRWLGGMVCAKNMTSQLKKSFYKALASNGSYYAKSNDSGLVVIPSLEIVAFIYFD